MSDRYPASTLHYRPVGISYARPRQHYPRDLRLDSPAVEGITCLGHVTALTVERTNTLAATRERMRKLGVKTLLVTGATANSLAR